MSLATFEGDRKSEDPVELEVVISGCDDVGFVIFRFGIWEVPQECFQSKTGSRRPCVV